jgi:hypothetical protein
LAIGYLFIELLDARKTTEDYTSSGSDPTETGYDNDFGFVEDDTRISVLMTATTPDARAHDGDATKDVDGLDRTGLETGHFDVLLW